MKYRLGVVQLTDFGAELGVGPAFNIANEHGKQIVTFAYLDQTDAEKARELIEKAIADAALIVGAS